MSKNFIKTNEDCINKYFRDIKKNKLLTHEEEIELAKRIQNGDSEAVNQLVNANLKFVISIAKNYQNQGLPLNDLINEGNEGLVKAAYKFDYTKGFRFISYAVWWIKQSILQSLNDHSRIVRLPVNQINKISKQKKNEKKFESEFERFPIKDEIVNDEVFQDLDYPIFSSLNCIMNDDHDEFIDLIPDDTFNKPDKFDDDYFILRKKISSLLSILSPRERDIIECYYGLTRQFESMTLEGIGERYNLTKERIRQIKERALRKLRSNIYDIINVKD